MTRCYSDGSVDPVVCAWGTRSKHVSAENAEQYQQQTVAGLHTSGLGTDGFTTAVNYMGTLMAFPGLVLMLR
ncbi:hypothetical protein BU16DRAFT_375934 [Lophium mytilinum]|uniref:Uncharacterized protein n=1 Tax=Lophium mytilinum TaxID=390894 RepID=A0A6A6QW93_9PEZI|nr:hypothetical protein BU16DRAFT_375934 [Lophium mytilinum]